MVIADGELDADVVVEEQFTHVPPFRPVADAGDIAAALNALSKRASR